MVSVLHICPYMHPAAGGPPIVVDRLAALASNHGWHASVITTSLYCEDEGQALEQMLRSRIDAQVLPCDRSRIAGLASAAGKAIEEGVRQSDIIHLHTLWHPLNTIARRACSRLGRRYVLTPHGMLDPIALRMKAVRKRLYLLLRERWNLLSASRLIFATAVEEQLARLAVPWMGSGEVIPLAADRPPAASPNHLANGFKTRFPKTAARRCLLFLGRIHHKKGIDTILQALPAIAAVHPDILLVIAGSGEAAYVRSLQRDIEREGVSQHVIFTGLLVDDLKWGALASSELFLLPSRQENFAIAVAEAMHMGIPVVISDRVNSWTAVTEARAGVVLAVEQLPENLAGAIIALLNDPLGMREMGDCGRGYAQRNFVWEQTADRTYALYCRVLEEGCGQ